MKKTVIIITIVLSTLISSCDPGKSADKKNEQYKEEQAKKIEDEAKKDEEYFKSNNITKKGNWIFYGNENVATTFSVLISPEYQSMTISLNIIKQGKGDIFFHISPGHFFCKHLSISFDERKDIQYNCTIAQNSPNDGGQNILKINDKKSFIENLKKYKSMMVTIPAYGIGFRNYRDNESVVFDISGYNELPFVDK